MKNYHKITLSIIAFITTMGFVVPFTAAAYCDSIQSFGNGCVLLDGGIPSPIFQLAGSEIYYDYMIYHMNPYLRENPNVDNEVFSITGSMPKEFSNQVFLKFGDERQGFAPEPRTLLINLKHNSTATVFNESQLGYEIFSGGLRDAQLAGSIGPNDSWSNEFDNVGLYSYRLMPISEYDDRQMHIQILVIDEPVKDMPKAIKTLIACRLLSIDHTEHPFVTGRSCGSSDTHSIKIDLNKSVRGASPEFKQEFLDNISHEIGFLEPDIVFEYEESRIYWSIPFPLMISSLPEVFSE